MIRTDPYTKEDFETNKRNKTFVTRENQIAYNNELKAQEREDVKFMNDKLLHNRRVLKTLLNAHSYINVTKEQINKLGFHFRAITHYFNDNAISVFAVYEYTYIILNNNEFNIQKNGREFTD